MKATSAVLKNNVPAGAGTCPSCDTDLPAGSRFCGICGVPVQQAETGQLTEQQRLVQRQAEVLSRWLEPEVKRPRRLKLALLVSVFVALLAGAYAVAQKNPAEPVAATVRVADPTPQAGGSTVDAPVIGDSAMATITTVEPGTTAVAGAQRRELATIDTTSTRRPAPRRVPQIRKAARPVAPGVLQMLVTPWASVSIDRRPGLRRARGADTLAAGVPHRLHFERAGFATIDTTVTLRPGEQRVLEVHMTPTKP